MADPRINIVSDINDIVTYESITTDTVDRQEVANLEAKLQENDELIAKLQAENAEFLDKLAKAKDIIEKADALKQAEIEAQQLAEMEAEPVAEEQPIPQPEVWHLN